MELEAVAVIADLCRIVWHRREYVVLIRDALRTLSGGKLSELPEDVVRALKALTAEMEREAWKHHGNGIVMDRIEALRNACNGSDPRGVRLVVCLVPFQPRQRGRTGPRKAA